MSGKGKQPRVKGNLKPTSSSRAADLLGGDMAAINAFKANPALAFSQFSRSGGNSSSGPLSASSTPAAATAADSGSQSGASTPLTGLEQIDGQLASQLKRLGKNDSKTKLRALFELKSYAAEHSWETGLEGMMLAWPPLFKRHMFDADRRVRAAVAGVHAVLAKRAGKRLAPNLKLLIGPWVASYFDPHRDAAKVVRQAFEAVFPESKRTEVYSYCLGELLEFGIDNIVNQTPESLSDPRFTDAEDMRSKYEHVIGASFGVLALAIEEVPKEQVIEHKAEFDKVLGSKEALRFVANPSTFVRRSVYRLVRMVMLKCPELASDSYAVLAQALFANCFGESDSNAHGDMWDAVLLLTKNYPQAWIDDDAAGAAARKKKAAVVERLYGFLKARCRLAPTISYPSILALLANLPTSIVDDPTFQSELGDALWQGAAETAASAEAGSRAYHQENVALINAICECYSFLWARLLKSTSDSAAATAAAAAVGKEAGKEVDRLWHFYLQHADSSAEEMAGPIVKLYSKIGGLSTKYDQTLLGKVWAHASWFALQRLSGPAIQPIVYLIAQFTQLDTSAHKELADSAKKLVVGFCQLAVQSPDKDTAQKLIQTLSQLVPDIVFQEGFSARFSARLEGAGSRQDAVQLVVSRAQYLADTTGSVESAAQSIDAFIELSLQGNCDEASSSDAGAGLQVVTALLAALAESELGKSNEQWKRDVRLPQLERVLVSSLPQLSPSATDEASKSAARSAPSAELILLYGQVLLAVFRGTDIVSAAVADKVFALTERAFEICDEIQNAPAGAVGRSESASAWGTAAFEAMSVWIALARDEEGGARFVRQWVQRTGKSAGSVLGRLFGVAVSANAEGKGTRHVAQVRRAWAAVEAQVARQDGLGAELAKALGGAVARDIDASRDPRRLARVAHAVLTRVCTANDSALRSALAAAWVLDVAAWQRAVASDAHEALGDTDLEARYLAQASAAGSVGLRQAVDDFGGATAQSFHTLAQWAAAGGGRAPQAGSETGARLARRAEFAAEFVGLAGAAHVRAAGSVAAVAALVLHLGLAFVLLRETLQAGAAAEGAADAAKAMQDAAAALLEGADDLVAGDPAHGPRDPAGWLGVLARRAVDGDADPANGPDGAMSVWDHVAATCVVRSSDAAAPWALVLGTAATWMRWAHNAAAADVEAAVASSVARRVDVAVDAAAAALLTVVARATALRIVCADAPAMRSALLAVATQAARHVGTGDDRPAVALLELLAELLPARRHALDAAVAGRIARTLHAVPSASSALPLRLAALAVLQRLAECTASVDAATADGLARLCLRWFDADAGTDEGTHDALLVAAARAAAALAQLPVDGSARVPDGPSDTMRQLAERVVNVCIVCDRPLPEGVRAATLLVRAGHAHVPAFARLLPLLANAAPRLATELARLVLAADDLPAYMDGHADDVVHLASSAALALADLAVPSADFADAMEADEFVRCAGLRLLLGLLLVARCADAQAAACPEQSDELADLLGSHRVFDSAMPWLCALLGLGGNNDSSEFNPRLWDLSAGLDWASWVSELAQNPGGEQLFRLLACHILVRLAWTFPATLRSWWSGLPQSLRPTAVAVEAFMSKHISPHLIEREMRRIRPQQQLADDQALPSTAVSDDLDHWDLAGDAQAERQQQSTAIVQVLAEYDESSVRATATQVALAYTVDDSTLEILVRVPPSYPLALPVFESVKRVAVNEKRWRCWQVAAQAQMARNCRLDSVCAQILGNIGAHFAGVEDCAICYSAVGVLDNSLPSKQCKTCKNKFHRMCLFKWFNTSNQSTCPLCRNLF